MEDIERMAALCMKDLDEDGDEDGDLENDADLLVRQKHFMSSVTLHIIDRFCMHLLLFLCRILFKNK